MSSHNNPKALEQQGKYIVNIEKAEGDIHIGDRDNLKSQSPKTIPQNIPRSGAVKFVGREEVLEELHQQLEQNKRIAITAITGMGGLGKTELALQYAQRQWEKGTYPGGVCWLRVRSRDVGIQIISFARSQFGLKPPEDWDLPTQINYCWRQWPEGKVLIVLDDVVDYEEIKTYLPPTDSRFLLLLTTRQKLGVSIESLDLEVLSPTAALELLQAIVGHERIEREPEQAEALCKWLGYLPLALELIGRYLQKDKTLSLAKVQTRLEKKRLAAKALCKTQADMTNQLGVAAAFELTWVRLPEKAQELGCLLGLFAAAPFEWQLVEACLAEWDEEDLEEVRNDYLLSWHLLTVNSEQLPVTGTICHQYSLHPLIREFFQTKLELMAEVDKYRSSFCQVMVAVAQEISERPTRQEIEAVSSTIPHMAEAATTFIDWLEDEDLIEPFVGLSNFYKGQGVYQQAIPWFEQCLSLSRKRLGQSHPDVAISLNNLALLYESQGRYQEAEPFYLEALEMLKRLLGQSHPHVASSLNNLGFLYQSQGRSSEAKPLYQQALDIAKEKLGKNHPNTLLFRENLKSLEQ